MTDIVRSAEAIDRATAHSERPGRIGRLIRRENAARGAIAVGESAKRAAATATLAVLWLVGAAFVAVRLNQGWVPLDDGTLAQSALRVLDGELPHRDFGELYTGGLTFLNAGVLGLLGENLIWLRVPLFILFVAYIPCVYAIARRFANRGVAALIAAFAIGWGLPAYPAAMPSWYLLIFACFGVLALIKHRETGNTRWLVVAGLLGGLSISVKVVGVLYVMAALLYFLVLEQAPHPRGRMRGRPSAYAILSAVSCAVAFIVVAALVRTHFAAAELVNFVLPTAALCLFVAHSERGTSGPKSRERLGALLRLCTPFLLGVSIPIGLLLAPYAVSGSVGDLLTGMFVTPQARLGDAGKAYYQTPSPVSLLFAVPVLAVIAARWRGAATSWRLLDRVTAVAFGLALVASVTAFGFLLFWHSARSLAPIAVILGALVLARLPVSASLGDRRPDVFLLLAMAGLLSLVQFPFGAPIYLCFVASLTALASLAVLRYAGASNGLLPITLLFALVIFGLVMIDRSAIYRYGLTPQANPHTVILDETRASIRVTLQDRAVYRRAVRLLTRHSRGPYVFAGPDTPELYVLSDRRNPTRSLFDWLDPSDSARGDELRRRLRARDVRAIAINLRPPFSEPLEAETLSYLRAAYPEHERFAGMEVRWRVDPIR